MSTLEQTTSGSQPSAELPARVPRIWPGVLLVAMYWAFVTALGRLDLEISTVFLSTMAASALLLLAFSTWWLTNGTIPRRERFVDFSLYALAGIAVGLLCDPSMGLIGLVFAGVPMVTTAWMAGFALIRRRESLRRWSVPVVILLVWSLLTLVRVDGVDGQNQATISYRWSPSKEDRYLEQLAAGRTGAPAEEPAAGAEPTAGQTLEAAEGDWPEFRGANRQGEVHNVRIETDWDTAPPRALWRRPIGPAWSSVVIIGDRLFTQEQRGEQECVVCLDATTGREIWCHQDKTRYSDGQAGAGPRATPTFANGSIYSLGASGILNCLDAASGKLKWTRNIATDSGAPVPMWGFSSSPLVADDVVVVYCGAEKDKGVLAYRAADGQEAWSAAAGPSSYSSAQRATIDGESQVLFFSDSGLVAVDSKTGTQRWSHDAPGHGTWRVVQPRQLDESSVLVGSEDLGLVLLELKSEDGSYRVAPRFSTRAIRPAYNDFVVCAGFIYGFDESIFCCVDAQNGKRRWKAGRYGHGQVLLVADQPLLLVISESGEAILLAVNPEKHEELGRFQAVNGKTWNHPVIAHGKLFTRNDEEIACYELRMADGK